MNFKNINNAIEIHRTNKMMKYTQIKKYKKEKKH